MPVIRTDDAARRLQFPIGPWWAKAAPPVWGTFLASVAVLWAEAATAASFIVPHLSVRGAALTVLVAALAPLVIAYRVTQALRSRITRATPVRYHLATLRSERAAPRANPDLLITYETGLRPDHFTPPAGRHPK